MKNLFLPLLICLISSLGSLGQQTPNQTLNLSFEKTDDKGKITGCYFSTGRDDYFSFKDDSVKTDGNNSLRLQKENGNDKAGFGVVTFSLPANFKGTEVTLRGYIKTENVEEGYAGLWLRTDAGTTTVGLDNMNDKGVEGTEDWKQYSISLPMNEEVTFIAFGGILTGKGKCWFDKLELLADGKPIQEATWIKDKVKPARKELTVSGVQIDSVLTIQQKENLFVLGKLWGFLKYHHPEVAKGNYNFDSCLFVVLPKALKAENSSERNEVLLNWINTLGDETKYPAVADTGIDKVHTRPAFEWLTDKKLFSETLSARLKNIYDHRNAGPNYYVRLAQGIGNPVFDKEAVYKSVPASDDGFRMLALFRYWNMIEYFFPYKHLFKEDWNDVLRGFITDFAADRSELNYRLACLRLINRVHDTHANIYNDPLLLEYFGENSCAVDFKMIDNKIIVTGFFNDSLTTFETLKMGDEILAVNGKNIADLKKEATPYLCASNNAVADRNFIDRFLFRSREDSLSVTYKRKNKTGKTILRLYAPGKVAYQNGDNWRMPMDTLLSPDIGYISLGKIKKDSLGPIFKRLDKTKGIIIDIRNYPKDFMPFAMGAYLKKSSTPFVKFTIGDIANPGLFTFTDPINNGPDKPDTTKKYNGTIVLLVNEQSQSQAEYTAMALRSAPRAVVMGSQTAGADGNISYVTFPGGFSSPFSGIGVFYPDGKETQGVGIVPDIIILPSQKGIVAGKDELLEKAMEHIRKMKAF